MELNFHHWPGIIGSVIGIVGTIALSIDLIMSKTAEESVKAFRKLQDEVEIASQELIANMHLGMWRLADFLSGYLSLVEIKKEANEGILPPEAKAETKSEPQSFTEWIKQHPEAALRQVAIEKFKEATKKLSTPEEVQHGLALISRLREQVNANFGKQVALSKRLKTIAMLGVVLVGIGAIAQFCDLLLVA